MGDSFRPLLEKLPAPQRRLWDELSAVPTTFVLYGGTALTLRLGHRVSEDFDFFSQEELFPDQLERLLSAVRGVDLERLPEIRPLPGGLLP